MHFLFIPLSLLRTCLSLLLGEYSLGLAFFFVRHPLPDLLSHFLSFANLRSEVLQVHIIQRKPGAYFKNDEKCGSPGFTPPYIEVHWNRGEPKEFNLKTINIAMSTYRSRRGLLTTTHLQLHGEATFLSVPGPLSSPHIAPQPPYLDINVRAVRKREETTQIGEFNHELSCSSSTGELAGNPITSQNICAFF